MRIRTAAIVTTLSLGWLVCGCVAGLAGAEPAPSGVVVNPVTPKMIGKEFSAQTRKALRRSRVRIYRSSIYPGPNAVRICNAHYEPEYRPSGTVIVPRMRCYWSG